MPQIQGIGPFEAPSREIASRKTKTAKTAQPAIGGVIFEEFAFVDVVVDKGGSTVIAPDSSFHELLTIKGSNCSIVTIIYCDTEAAEREEKHRNDLFYSELAQAREEGWAQDPTLINIVNRESHNAFWALGRSAPVATQRWLTLGGCFLKDGLLTTRDAILPLTIDDVWQLWRKGSWGSPEPADDNNYATHTAKLGDFLNTCGWDYLPSPQ